MALVGWHPDVVDYSKWPNLTAETLRNLLERDQSALNALGYRTDLLFIHSPETAFDSVRQSLSNTAYDCVLIGAGVRTVEDHFIVFEQLINAVHPSAPSANICFNTNPLDTAEAVQRWV